jgi:hypothetical protein
MDGVQAQQLRLHHSHHIDCYNIHIHAGTILEDCHHVTFHVPSTTTDPNEFRMNIQDFNWLKNGIPSPNFTIQMYNAPMNITTTTTTTTAVEGTDPSVSFHHNNNQTEYNDSDDDEI